MRLVEESKEALEAAAGDRAELVKEIGDVYEVIDALLGAFGIEKDEVAPLPGKRREKRGGFAERLELLWVDEG